MNSSSQGSHVSPSSTGRSEAQSPAGWRDISNAPTDPRVEVLLIGRYPDERTWSDVYHCWAQAPYHDGWATHWARWPHSFPPTHWMPVTHPDSAGVDVSTEGSASLPGRNKSLAAQVATMRELLRDARVWLASVADYSKAVDDDMSQIIVARIDTALASGGE